MKVRQRAWSRSGGWLCLTRLRAALGPSRRAGTRTGCGISRDRHAGRESASPAGSTPPLTWLRCSRWPRCDPVSRRLDSQLELTTARFNARYRSQSSTASSLTRNIRKSGRIGDRVRSDRRPRMEHSVALATGGAPSQGSGVFRTYPVLCSMRWWGGICAGCRHGHAT